MKPRIAVLASGGGTTAEAFIDNWQKSAVNCDVIAVISNQKNPAVFKKINSLNKKYGQDIKCLHIGKENYPPESNEEIAYGHQTMAEEKAILDKLLGLEVDFVVLMGYMKLIGQNIVKEYGFLPEYKSVYQARMVNTHPGILPDTKGLYGIHVQEYVLINSINKAGHCLFAVDTEYDAGPIVAEHRVEILPNDTPELLFERVRESERKYIASDIENFLTKQKEYNQQNG